MIGCGRPLAVPLSLLPIFLAIQYNLLHGNCQNPGGAGVYYLTLAVVYWLPVFVSAEPCLIFTESLNYCQQNKNLRINAFVIMPTHTHIIVFDADFDNKRTKFDYLHDNPRRKGLVHEAADWRFSSAAYWLREQVTDCDVRLTGVAW